MKTCSKCHLLLPFDAFYLRGDQPKAYRSQCKTCTNTSKKAYYATHKEPLRQWQALYNAAHREQYRQNGIAYRAAHPEQERQRHIAYRARCPEEVRQRINARARAYHAAHREKISQRNAAYHQAHREEICRRKVQVNNPIRRARLRNASVVESIDLEVVATRDRGICHICRKKATKRTWSLDHLIPLSKGGDHTYINVALAHRRCNSSRAAGRLVAQLRLLP